MGHSWVICILKQMDWIVDIFALFYYQNTTKGSFQAAGDSSSNPSGNESYCEKKKKFFSLETGKGQSCISILNDSTVQVVPTEIYQGYRSGIAKVS